MVGRAAPWVAVTSWFRGEGLPQSRISPFPPLRAILGARFVRLPRPLFMLSSMRPTTRLFPDSAGVWPVHCNEMRVP